MYSEMCCFIESNIGQNGPTPSTHPVIRFFARKSPRIRRERAFLNSDKANKDQKSRLLMSYKKILFVCLSSESLTLSELRNAF